MAAIEIGRLALEVPGLSPGEGRRLAEMVAEGLAGVDWSGAAAGAAGTHRDRVTVTVPADLAAPTLPGSRLDRLAATIIAELRRQLN